METCFCFDFEIKKTSWHMEVLKGDCTNWSLGDDVAADVIFFLWELT